MPETQSVEPGQRYEAWSAAPGYPPSRCTVVRMDDKMPVIWCWVRYDLAGPTERPVRCSSLLTPKLWRRIGAIADWRRREPSDG
jgi:hypothetical protein